MTLYSRAAGLLLVATSDGSPKEALVLPGEDHIYHLLGDDQKGADAVITKTADWFGKTL
jgi:hypothetical protein